MKTLGLFLAGWLVITCGAAYADDTGPAPLKVTIAIPSVINSDQEPVRTLVNQQPDAHFHVVIENVSSEPVIIWDEGNSEGYGTISLEVTEPGGKTTVISRPDGNWSKNALAVDRLDPGESQVREVFYTTDAVYHQVRISSKPSFEQWLPEFPFPPSGEKKTVTLRAVFEEKQVPELSDKWAVWFGRVVSPDYSVVLAGG